MSAGAPDPAGLAVEGRGSDPGEALAQVALAVFALLAAPASVAERDRRELRAHGDSPAALVVAWIGECLYLHEVEGFLARRVEVLAFEDRPGSGGEPLRLHALLHGEEIDPDRHPPGTLVRCVRREGALLEPHQGGWRARLLVEAEPSPK
jgi:SHS2 domain-containing protein